MTAVGNAGGVGGTPSQASGSVIALDQSITAGDALGGEVQRLTGLIETNAAVRPGDSGGPLVNNQGRAIGMDTAASVGYTFHSSASQGFAIPINDALSIARQIESGVGSSTVHIGRTAFLGVAVRPPGDGAGASSGALLNDVVSGSPAQQAGLTAGDTIVSIDGQAITSGTTLQDLLVPHHPGDTVQVQWLDQSGQTHSAAVQLAGGPPA